MKKLQFQTVHFGIQSKKECFDQLILMKSAQFLKKLFQNSTFQLLDLKTCLLALMPIETFQRTDLFQ